MLLRVRHVQSDEAPYTPEVLATLPVTFVSLVEPHCKAWETSHTAEEREDATDDSVKP